LIKVAPNENIMKYRYNDIVASIWNHLSHVVFFPVTAKPTSFLVLPKPVKVHSG